MKYNDERAHQRDARPDYVRDSHRRQRDNKLAQVCRQVQRTLSLTLAGECHDELLQRLCVHDVLPAPDASRLLVQVYFPDAQCEAPLIELLERLDRIQPWLRREVAHAIVRKRAPELAFQLIAPGAAQEADHV